MARETTGDALGVEVAATVLVVGGEARNKLCSLHKQKT